MIAAVWLGEGLRTLMNAQPWDQQHEAIFVGLVVSFTNH